MKSLFLLLASCFLFQSLQASQQDEQRLKINSEISQDRGIYLLDDLTFDPFINWNDLVLVCFHEAKDTQSLMLEYLTKIRHDLDESNHLFKVALVQLDNAKVVEGRFKHMTPPDIRIFSKAKDIKYLGPLDVKNLLDWVVGKVGIP